MAKFEDAVQETLKFEGGYVYDPNDPGGETNMGITKRDYPDVDIKNLTVEQAKEIYRRDFWNSLYDEIISQPLANKLFDMGVNMGERRAVQRLQLVLPPPQIIDGIFGPETLQAVNLAGESLLPKYKLSLEGYYRSLVTQKPALNKFLTGWLRRVYA
jgi:lysozyme family protein